MLITELIQTKHVKTPISKQEIDDIHKIDIDAPERGAYAIGKPTNDPHVYTKQTIHPTNITKDPTYLYIKTIEPLINNNPYFPKTYIVNLKYDNQNNIRPSYDVETLVHGPVPPPTLHNPFIAQLGLAMQKTKPEEPSQPKMQGKGYTGNALYYMASKMYGTENWIKASPNTYQQTIKKDPTNDPQYIWANLCSLYRQLLDEYPNTPTITKFGLNPEPKLMQSLHVIKKLMTKYPSFENDLHHNNFMIRRTSLGPQLVINDPLSPNSTTT